MRWRALPPSEIGGKLMPSKKLTQRVVYGRGGNDRSGLGEEYFQVYEIAANGKILVRLQLRRGEVLKFFQSLPPCLVGTET